MSVRTRIEWFTGQKLGYETADELGIGEFTLGVRTVGMYLAYARYKARRKAKWGHMMRAGCGADPEFRYRMKQRLLNIRGRTPYWRRLGYPNLRKAWAARHRNCLRRKAEKELEAKRAAIRRDLERYGL